MYPLSRHLWWLLLAASFFLAVCTPLGIFFSRRSNSHGEEEDVDFDDEDEEDEDEPMNLLEMVTCFELSQSFRAYWDCLVEGPEGATIELPSRDAAVFRLQKANVSKTGTPKVNKGRVKRTAGQYYSPLDPEVVFTFIPFDHAFWKDEELRQPHNDYVKQLGIATSPYLYEFYHNTSEQSNPPWSYHGIIPPQEWHLLDIQKFLTPLSPMYSPRQALFRNLFVERQFIFTFLYNWCFERDVPEDCDVQVEDGIAFRKLHRIPDFLNWAFKVTNLYLLADESVDKVFPPDDLTLDAKLASDHIPDLYFSTLHDINKYIVKTRSIYTPQLVRDQLTMALHTDIPQRGFYSAMRFLLPPYISDKELTALRHDEKAAIDKNFIRANRNNLNLNKYLLFLKKEIFNDETNETINQLGKSYYADRIFRLYVQGPVKDPAQAMTEEEVMHAAYQFIRDDINKIESALIERERYSLPLFPLIFPICRHREPSPIDIHTKRAIHGALGPFTVGSQGCRRFPMRVSFPSDGTNVLSLKLHGSQSQLGTGVTLSDGAVRGNTLIFDEMHVHIGTGENDGSEHRLDGKGFAMELQLIFQLHGADTKTPYFFTLARQMNDLFPVRENIVLILAVFVEVVAKPENEFLFEPLAQAASQFRKVSENTTLKGRQFRGYRTKQPAIALREFIPNSVYYTYRGSLTIPPCFPYVIWSVFEKPLQISKHQFEELQLWPSPSTDDTDFLAGNVRNPEDVWVEQENQPQMTQEDINELRDARNHRLVIKSNPTGFNPDYYSTSKSSITSPSFILILVTVSVNVFILTAI